MRYNRFVPDRIKRSVALLVVESFLFTTLGTDLALAHEDSFLRPEAARNGGRVRIIHAELARDGGDALTERVEEQGLAAPHLAGYFSWRRRADFDRHDAASLETVLQSVTPVKDSRQLARVTEAISGARDGGRIARSFKKLIPGYSYEWGRRDKLLIRIGETYLYIDHEKISVLRKKRGEPALIEGMPKILFEPDTDDFKLTLSRLGDRVYLLNDTGQKVLELPNDPSVQRNHLTIERSRFGKTLKPRHPVSFQNLGTYSNDGGWRPKPGRFARDGGRNWERAGKVAASAILVGVGYLFVAKPAWEWWNSGDIPHPGETQPLERRAVVSVPQEVKEKVASLLKDLERQKGPYRTMSDGTLIHAGEEDLNEVLSDLYPSRSLMLGAIPLYGFLESVSQEEPNSDRISLTTSFLPEVLARLEKGIVRLRQEASHPGQNKDEKLFNLLPEGTLSLSLDPPKRTSVFGKDDAFTETASFYFVVGILQAVGEQILFEGSEDLSGSVILKHYKERLEKVNASIPIFRDYLKQLPRAPMPSPLFLEYDGRVRVDRPDQGLVDLDQIWMGLFGNREKMRIAEKGLDYLLILGRSERPAMTDRERIPYLLERWNMLQKVDLNGPKYEKIYPPPAPPAQEPKPLSPLDTSLMARREKDLDLSVSDGGQIDWRAASPKLQEAIIRFVRGYREGVIGSLLEYFESGRTPRDSRLKDLLERVELDLKVAIFESHLLPSLQSPIGWPEEVQSMVKVIVLPILGSQRLTAGLAVSEEIKTFYFYHHLVDKLLTEREKQVIGSEAYEELSARLEQAFQEHSRSFMALLKRNGYVPKEGEALDGGSRQLLQGIQDLQRALHKLSTAP